MDAGLSVIDNDPNFEPQIRARSNTWPCRPAEDFADGQQQSPASDDPGVGDHTKDALGIKQKTTSRRNAWGNLSYADLITKAIQSSPEQRLTLSQIYDWMVQNVPYFKDKGDNTSSAGWKNSIRHNLSLHSRFMRIQNEGTGKSSWWVINPDAKPGKAPRRRAGSMETKSLEKKRGRIKKRIESIRAAQENGTLSNDDFPDFPYNSSLSPEFRGRAGSNASSCGRLSPIQAAVEPDLHDSQVPPMSPIPWDTEIETDDFVNTNSSESFSLVDSLVGGLNLKETGNLAGDQNDIEMTLKQQLMSGGSMIRYNTPNSFDESGYGGMPAPPSYSDHLQQQNSQRTVLNLDSRAAQNRNYTNLTTKQPMEVYPDNVMAPQMLSSQNMPSPGSNSLGVNVSPQLNSPARSPQLSPSNYPQAGYSPQPIKRSPQPQMMSPAMNQQQQQQQAQPQDMESSAGSRSLLQQCLEAPTDSMLRQALTQQMNVTYQSQQTSHPQQVPYMQYNNSVFSRSSPQSPGLNNINNNITMVPQSSVMSYGGPVQNVPQMGQSAITGNMSNSSLDIEIDKGMLDLDCDYEQIFRHELAIDPSLDFNFDSSPSTQNVPTSDNQNLVRTVTLD